MKKGLLCCSTLALVGACLLTGCSGSAFPHAKERYCIGASGPLTGDAAMYGLGVKNSAEMAIEEINAAGGVNNTLLEFAILDDVCEGSKASTNFNALYEGGMKVSLGCVTSGACLAYEDYAKKNNVFCLTPSATNDKVPDGQGGIYQVCFKDGAQGTLAVQYIQEHYSKKKIGVFYDASDDYSKGIYDTFVKIYGKTGYTTASFTSETKTDFSAQVNTLKDCDFIFLPIYYTEAALFIKTAKNKVAADTIYFGCDGLDGIDSLEGFNVKDYSQKISYLSHFDAKATTGKAGEFINKYKAKYNGKYLNQFGAAAYDAVYTIAEAIRGTNLTPASTAKEFKDAIVAKFANGFKYTGATGENMSWDVSTGTVVKKPIQYFVN